MYNLFPEIYIKMKVDRKLKPPGAQQQKTHKPPGAQQQKTHFGGPQK